MVNAKVLYTIKLTKWNSKVLRLIYYEKIYEKIVRTFSLVVQNVVTGYHINIKVDP